MGEKISLREHLQTEQRVKGEGRNFAWCISVAFKRLSGRHKSMGRGVGQIRTAFFVP